MDFDRGVYALAWTAFRANYTLCAALVLLIAFMGPVLQLLGVDQTFPIARSTLIPILVNLASQWTLIHGGRTFAGAAWRSVRLLRFAVWSLLLAVPAAFAAVAALSSGAGGGEEAGMAAVFFPVFLLVYLVTLAACGTILPEIAAGGRGNLVLAMQRGARAFLPALGYLLAGPFALAVLVLLGAILPQLAGIPVWVLDPETAEVSWLGTAAIVLIDLVSVFADVLMAAALCKAHHRGGGRFGAGDG